MTETPLPVGVLMPVLNAGALLRSHLVSVRAWLDLVQELVVVDSFSDDGTFETLQAELKHPRVRLLQRPRGLYACWNFGVGQLTAPWAYISTAGDSITPDGLRKLVRAGEELSCGVVLSRPEIVNEQGQPMPEIQWPVHKFLSACPMEKPAVLEPWQVFILATLDMPQGILGSSASNLYRAKTLQRFPFPTDYGHAGDAAWAILHAFEVSFGVTPEIFSRFVQHENETHHMKPEQFLALVERMSQAGRGVVEGALACEPRLSGAGLLPDIAEIQVEVSRLRQRQLEYETARRRFFPWFVNPAAWRARAERIRQRERVRQMAAVLRRSLPAKLPRGADGSARVVEYFTRRLEAI